MFCLNKINFSGILVIGGPRLPRSVEIWSAAHPEQGGCVLNYYPREMLYGSTVNLVSKRLIACWYDTCEIFQGGSWQHLQETIANRTFHSNAATEEAVLLIGGSFSNTTEWIPMDGSPAKLGPFTLRHGPGHCTIQISADVLVVTGGTETEAYVTQYHLDDGSKTSLTPLGQPRSLHACGVYQDLGGQQVNSKASQLQALLCNLLIMNALSYFEILQNFSNAQDILKVSFFNDDV